MTKVLGLSLGYELGLSSCTVWLVCSFEERQPICSATSGQGCEMRLVLLPLTKRVLEVIGGTDLMYVFCSVALYTGVFLK